MAIDHTLAAEDFEHAARLLEQVAETTLWHDSRHVTLLAWMQRTERRRTSRSSSTIF